MHRFRKKPEVIEAVKFTGDVGVPEIVELGLGCAHDPKRGHDYLVILTSDGPIRVDPGDWIVANEKGELRPCKPDIFEAKYEPADA